MNPNEKIADIFDELLDNMYGSFEKAAKEYNSKSVPLNLIKMYHDIIKKNYRKEINDK